MIVTVFEKFKNFCDNLQMSNRDTVGLRYRAIIKRLNKDFWGSDSETAHSIDTGSYGRGTAMAGCSDIDMIMELPWDLFDRYANYQTNGQSALLQAGRTSRRMKYPSTDIGGDGQVVAVKFADGLCFEVVPCFPNEDGSFCFPDSTSGGRWRKTDPRPEIKAIKDLDRDSNRNLQNLCRMVRAWRDYYGVAMGGLLVDTFCYKFIESWRHCGTTYENFGLMTKDFFEYLSAQDDDQRYWLASGSRQHVYGKGPFVEAVKWPQRFHDKR